MKKVSLQDIADKLGVSRCTVSLALSGKGREKRVSSELCNKIIKTAKEMRYEPNELARGLRTGLTKTLGVIVADISNEFFGELVYHIQKRSNQNGYDIIIMNADEAPSKMLESINILINRQVDGIIMVPTNSSAGVASHIVSMSIPLVQVDRYLPDLKASYVILDNYKASAEVTKLLYESGCRRIAMIRHKTSALNGRFEGYESVMKDRGLFDEGLVKNIRYSSEAEDLRQAMSEFSGMGRAVDAVIFQSHELFFGGAKYINDKRKVKIATFDKSGAFSLIDFPLVFVEQPVKKIAYGAVDILMGHIKGSREIIRMSYEGKIRKL